MLSQAIWWSSVALESILLFRGFRGRLASRYPGFYFYIAFVLIQDVFCMAFARLNTQDSYNSVYWTAELLCVLVSCGIVFEVYRVGLAAYPGTARMARWLLAFVIAVILAKALLNIARDPRWWSEASATGVESSLRTIEGLALAALVALFLFYSIPFGKNLRGIVVALALLVCWSVLCLTFASSTSGHAHDVWKFLYSGMYPFVLGLWLVPLWSYKANPKPEHEVQLEVEYQRIASFTQRRLRSARGYLAKAVGS